MRKWSFTYCSTNYKFNTRCVWQSPPASIHVVHYLVPYLFLLLWTSECPCSIKFFLPPFYQRHARE